MDTIETNIQLLVWSIKRSPEYKEYKRCEERINQQPELWKGVDEFCIHNYKLQNDREYADNLNNLDALNKESEDLLRIPEVNAYLQAELNLCKLLQEISLDINGGLDIHIPKL